MKSLVGTLIFIALLPSVSIAADPRPRQLCETADFYTVGDGQTVTLHYRQNPRQEIGPAYTCAQVARVRTCIGGKFSETPVVCSTRDSGGCADSWIEKLDDSAFVFGICAD